MIKQTINRCGVFIVLLCLCMSLAGLTDANAGRTITRLTDNADQSSNPRINESGQMAWLGLFWGAPSELDVTAVFFFDGTAVKKISNDEFQAGHPLINDRGQVVWIDNQGADSLFDVLLYDGQSVVPVTETPKHIGDIDINAKGQIVWVESGDPLHWSEWLSEIHFYDGSDTIILSEDQESASQVAPRINGNGQVVWVDGTGVLFFDGAEIRRIFSENSILNSVSPPRINDRGDIAFVHGGVVHLYRDGELTELAGDYPVGSDLQLNGAGQIAWTAFDGDDIEVFFYDGERTVQLTRNYTDEAPPRLNDNGELVWEGMKGGYQPSAFSPDSHLSREIFLYDGKGVVQVTRNGVLDTTPDLNNRGDIVWSGGKEGGGAGYEIYLAVKNQAEEAGYLSLLQWPVRGGDTYYCLDILDDAGEVIRRAVACGEGLHEYESAQLDLPAGTYGWRVWSPSGYGGIGFEGRFAVACYGPEVPYGSNHGNISWANRGADTFYCVDILDSDGNMLRRAVACGEGLHRYRPFHLNLPAGTYRWKVWSPSGYGGEGYEGEFSAARESSYPYHFSSYREIGWERRGADAYYCVDILDADGNMVRQAAACGEGLFDYTPFKLNLPRGNYRWKVWSPSGYGGEGFEGEFSVECESIISR